MSNKPLTPEEISREAIKSLRALGAQEAALGPLRARAEADTRNYNQGLRAELRQLKEDYAFNVRLGQGRRAQELAVRIADIEQKLQRLEQPPPVYDPAEAVSARARARTEEENSMPRQQDEPPRELAGRVIRFTEKSVLMSLERLDLEKFVPISQIITCIPDLEALRRTNRVALLDVRVSMLVNAWLVREYEQESLRVRAGTVQVTVAPTEDIEEMQRRLNAALAQAQEVLKTPVPNKKKLEQTQRAIESLEQSIKKAQKNKEDEIKRNQKGVRKFYFDE